MKWRVTLTSGAFVGHVEVEARNGWHAIELAAIQLEDEESGWPHFFKSAALTVNQVEEPK